LPLLAVAGPSWAFASGYRSRGAKVQIADSDAMLSIFERTRSSS